MTAKQNAHDFGKVEVLGLVDAVPGNVHHTVGQGSANEYTNTGYEKNGFKRSGLGAYRRVQKVNCIITDSDYQIENS